MWRERVNTRAHEYACARAAASSEGRRGRCQRVNPTLRLNIKLSDQGINNSDGSLSGSMAERGRRGGRGHNKGTGAI